MGKICDRTNDVVRFSEWETHQIGEYNAEICFSKSAGIFVEAEIDLEHAHTLREWAHYKFKIGEREKGEEMWQKAREIFAEVGAQKEVERMKDTP